MKKKIIIYETKLELLWWIIKEWENSPFLMRINEDTATTLLTKDVKTGNGLYHLADFKPLLKIIAPSLPQV